MMDANTVQVVTQFINNVGFPITVCIILLWMQISSRKQHAAETAQWIQAINNNTNAVNTMLEVLRTK